MTDTPDYHALCAAVRELLNGLDKVQDWDTTRVGDAMDAVEIAMLAAPEADGPYVKDCYFQGPPPPPYRSVSEWFESEGSKGQLRGLRIQAYPAPEAVGVTDEKLLKIWQFNFAKTDKQRFLHIARAVLSRYGTANPAPVPVGERPWERDGWCDREGRCWWWDAVASRWIWRTDEVGASLVEVTLSLPYWALPLPGVE